MEKYGMFLTHSREGEGNEAEQPPLGKPHIEQISRSTKYYIQNTKPISTDAALSKMMSFFPLRERNFISYNLERPR